MPMFLLNMRLVLELKDADNDKMAVLTKTIESPHVPQIGSCFCERSCDEPYAVDYVEWYPASYTFNVGLQSEVYVSVTSFKTEIRHLVERGWEVQNPESNI